MNVSQAMGELCTLMLQHQLTADTFARWVRRYYGAPREQGSEGLVRWVARHHAQPHPLDTLRVLEFDKFLRDEPSMDFGFRLAMVELRNVFARNANFAGFTTVSAYPTASARH
jgi:hypothetical protein